MKLCRVIACLISILFVVIGLFGCTKTSLEPSMDNAGRIVLINTVNSATSNLFDFELSYGAAVGYPDGLALGNNQLVDSGFILTPGSYTIVEAVPAGWQLTIQLDDPGNDSSSNGNQANIDVTAGETITVTFINTSIIQATQPTPVGDGRVRLIMQTVPSNGIDIMVSMSYGAEVSYPDGLYMSDGQEIDSGFTLTPGNYTIEETIPDGWRLTIQISDLSNDSSSNSNRANISVAAGETVTVTFINTAIEPTIQPTLTNDSSRILLILQTFPSDGTKFQFTMSYGAVAGYPDGVQLNDSFSQIDTGFTLPAGIYEINQIIISGWQLNIVIDDPGGDSYSSGNQTIVNLAAGETVTVTYVNSTNSNPTLTPGPTIAGNPGRIILIVRTIPAAGTAQFPVIMSYGPQIGYPDGIQLDATYSQVDSGLVLAPGIHYARETVPAGWQLAIEIGDPTGGSSASGNTVTIDLAPGETVTITLINTKTS